MVIGGIDPPVAGKDREIEKRNGGGRPPAEFIRIRNYDKLMGTFPSAEGSLDAPLINNQNELYSSGDLEQNLKITRKDEIGVLKEGFNEMVVDLKESKVNIENKVAERTADLEKLNKYMTGRELKMIELKKRIKELEDKNENS